MTPEEACAPGLTTLSVAIEGSSPEGCGGHDGRLREPYG